MRPPPLIVVAHAVAPGPGGAEAEVNAHFLQALAARWPAPVTAITAGSGLAAADVSPGAPRQPVVHALGECGERGAGAFEPSRLAAWSLRHRRSGGAGSVPARVINRVSHMVTGHGVKRAWNIRAARVLRQELARHPDAFVYSRVLPLASIEAVLAVRGRLPFPWIVNFNDPLPTGLWPGQYATDAQSDRRADAAIRRALPFVSAFTFSSEGLRRIEHGQYPSMTDVPSLVLPHVAPPAADGFDGAAPRGPRTRGLRIAFLGTLRANRVRSEFFEGLRQSVADIPSLRVSFLVPVANALLIDASGHLPSIVDVAVGQSVEAIARAAEDADVLLDLESEPDGPLLLAKTARYASCRKPIWAVCEQGGTTWNLATDHRWGYVTPLRDAGAVRATLQHIHADWQAGRLAERGPSAALARYFSGDRIVSELADLCATVADTSQRHTSPSPAAPPVRMASSR